MKFFNKKNTYEILKEGRYDTIAFRKVTIPVDIVEDIIGVEVSVPTRTA